MADIDIVPKQRSYTWLWILLALVILAVLWWAFAGGDTADVSPTGALQPALDQLAGLTGGLSRSA
jgi:hypothetical protein